MPINVQLLDCDFFTFSAHKMCGPTGLGVLYGKSNLLNKIRPLFIGGGSNVNYYKNGDYFLKNAPYKFEVGTLPLAQIFGLENAIKYLMKIDMNRIYEHETFLKEHAITALKAMDHVSLYNENNKNGIITFNVKGIYGSDIARYLDFKRIAVRSGQHCSRLLTERIGSDCSIRASIYFYNDIEDIDYFLSIVKTITKEKCYDFIFKMHE